MESYPIRRLLLGVMLALSFPHAAISQISLRATVPASVIVGSNLSYSISITNEGFGAPQLDISSTFSPSLRFVSATSNQNVSVSVSGNRVNFQLLQVAAGADERLNLTLRSTEVGTVTNRFVASVASFQSSTTVTSLVTQLPGNGDVAVTITPPSGSPILVNDWVAFGVQLRNLGAGTVSGIFLTNRFTNGPVLVKSFRPTAGATTALNPPRVIFNVGSLAPGQATNFQITVQPTAPTNITLVSNFRSSGSADTNAGNNIASRTISVEAPGTNRLVAQRASDQFFNAQNGYMEQLITVRNDGTNIAPNARLILSNITYRVANAIGTNNGHPFVLHAAPIQPTQTVELLLEYFIPSREPRPDPGLIPYSTTEVAPIASTNGINTNGSVTEFTHAVWRGPSGAMTETNLVLIFRSEPNARYELQYSSNMLFTNALRALPSLVAPANNTVWIDYGPPKTISRPRREVTFATNVTPISVVSTNVSYSTNDTGVVTNYTTITNLVGFTTNYVTNLNMRFYRAMKLP